MNIVLGGSGTMSSVDLVKVINEVRAEEGKAPLEHADFVKKIKAHPSIDAGKFSGIYVDSANRDQVCYHLPRRECDLMVMSDSRPVQAKVYDRIAALEAGRADPFAMLPPEQRALVQLMCDNVQIKARQAEIEAKQNEQQESIKRIEAKQSAFENGHSFFTAMGFCGLRDIKLSMRDMQRLGRRAGAISRKRGVPIDRVRDARYGMVNSYHEETLAQALNEIHGGM
ncbi:hypothetical protein [Massilia sp. BHUDP2]|uniref:hypothetical protein n=1 Tax=Massilia sp. BHUDP2 TaxID=3034505 RepID=UPI0039063041